MNQSDDSRENNRDLVRLHAIESILSLLNHRGLVDSELNRQDVKYALGFARELIAKAEEKEKVRIETDV